LSGWEAAIGDPLARWLEGAPLEVPAGITPLFEAVDVADERLAKLTANQKALLVALKIAAEHATARESARSLLERLARLHAWQEPGSTYTAFYLTALGVVAERARAFGWVHEAAVAEVAIRAHLDLWALCAVRVPGRRGVVAMPPGIRTGTGRHESIELLLGELAGLGPEDVPMQSGWWARPDNARRRSTVWAVRAALGGQMGARVDPDPFIAAWIADRSFDAGRELMQRLWLAGLGSAHILSIHLMDSGEVGALAMVPAGTDNPRAYTLLRPGRYPEVLGGRIDSRDAVSTQPWRVSHLPGLITVEMIGYRIERDGNRSPFAEAGTLALPDGARGAVLHLHPSGPRRWPGARSSQGMVPWEEEDAPPAAPPPAPEEAVSSLDPAQWAKAEEQAERVQVLIAERNLEPATTVARRLLARLEGRLVS
jgi:hypothetical protein